MGKDEFFKKKKAERALRKSESRLPKSNSFLIVTEGTETEPNYFSGVAQYIKTKYGGEIDVHTLPSITTDGKGMGTRRLVEAAIEKAGEAKIPYAHVWVVFDKDNFDDFEQAIKDADDYGFGAAWSNACFEYWLYLHFHYSDSALHRAEWKEKVNELFRQQGINGGKYTKNFEELFSFCTSQGSLKAAISHARRIHAQHCNQSRSPDQCDPCTTVYQLIEEFSPFLDDLMD